MELRRIILTCSLLLWPFSITTTRAFQAVSPVFYRAHGGIPSRHSMTILSPSSIVELPGDTDALSIGFLGCGTIASAIATGLARNTNYPSLKIMVTRRSESKSAALQARFPDIVVGIADDPQIVVDACDILFLCVLPQQTSSILQNLHFDNKRHFLVSLVSTSQIHQLAMDSKLPESHVSKMICLPAVAHNTGVCLVQFGGQIETDTNQSNQPPQRKTMILQLLERLGSYVEAKNDHEMSAHMVITGLMGSFYGTLRHQSQWLQNQTGIDKETAQRWVSQLHENMLQDTRIGKSLDDLVDEQTPGGLNEQGLHHLQTLGVLDAYDQIQDALFDRILGISDGSLK